MTTLAVVKAHDVAEEFNPGLSVGSKDAISAFAFQGGPETLDGGTIPTITDTAHADGHGGSGQSLLVIEAGVLATACKLMGQSADDMGNAQWVGHILKRLQLIDQSRRKHHVGGKLYAIERHEVLDMMQRYEIPLIENATSN